MVSRLSVRRFALFVSTLFLSAFVGAATITQWTFDSVPPDTSTSTGSETPSVGTGTFSLIGGVTATYATGNGGGTDNTGRNTSTYPAQGTGDKTRGVEFAVSTAGFNAIQFAFDLRHSNTSANTVVVQYSTDGTTFTDFTTFVATAGDTWFSRTVDFTSIAALNNNANAKFRVLSTFAAGGAVYVASNPASAYGGGTMRYDNVIVSGTAITSDAPPTVTSTLPATGATNVPVGTTITINFSEAVNVAAGGVTLVCGSPGTAIALNTIPANGVTNLVLTPASTLPNSVSCTITVVAANVADIDGAPNNMVTDVTASFSTASPIISNTAPTIVPTAGANPRLALGTASPSFVSGVISDPTDPASVSGIAFTIADAETTVASLTVSAVSNNATVVPNANIVITGTGASRLVKITPIGAGLATITVTVSDSTANTDYVINYAASAASNSPANSRFITGACDASSALALDASAMFVANDEDQQLRLYPRGLSGYFASSFDFTANLGLTDISGGAPREVDIEASTRIGNRIYWLGSHSNSSSGANRVNRSRLFATDISGTGTATTLSFVGYYGNLKADLIAWDDANGHGLGASALGFAVSAAPPVLPEAAGGTGFNIEALTVAPDGTTGYIAFRAPLATAATRDRALIVPITNFASLVSASPATGPATFGAPILLDLGGRAIRSIDRNAANQYLIIAGPPAAATGVAPADFRLYRWSGVATDAPQLFATDLTARGVVGSFEGIVEVPNPLQAGAQVQLLVDTGDTNFYGNGACKDLPNAAHKKARVETFDLVAPVTRIHAVQGSGAATPIPGATVTVEAIVTGSYQGSNQLRGFFLQEEDADADADPNTSEGIFVFCNTCPTPVVEGQRVRVTGVVSEFNDMTQITASTAGSVVVTDSGNNLAQVTPAVVSLPIAGDVNAFYEAREGMLVRYSNALSVSEYFELARYGQIVLYQGGRPMQFTEENAPSASGLTAYEASLARRRVILDDDNNVQNAYLNQPNGQQAIYHPRANGGFSTGTQGTDFFRGGDTVSGLTGILHWSFPGFGANTWRIRPTQANPVTFTVANPRPATPPAVGGTIKAASVNMLNYFTTIDTTASNDTGTCGPSGTLDCRGADSIAELDRQRERVSIMLCSLNADVTALMEMENTTATTVTDLLGAVNTRCGGANPYAFVNTGGTLGTDAIRVNIIYRTNVLAPVGPALSDLDPVHNRPPTAQTFEVVAAGNPTIGQRFTVIANHLKSKGCSGATGADLDQLDGQGCFASRRTAQASRMLAWITSTVVPAAGDPDVLMLGDFNSYAKEAPVTTLTGGGYADLASSLLGTGTYSYVFSGQLGHLDYALSSASLTPQVAGIGIWHINADESDLFDYDDAIRDTGEASFEEKPDGTALTLPRLLFEPASPYRASDHDPVLVGLNLTPNPANLLFDIDGSGSCDAINDPVLMIRYLLGLRDSALIEGLSFPSGARTPAQILAHLTGLGNVLDVDDDGSTLVTTDALMFQRYTRLATGPALTSGAIRPKQSGGVKTDGEVKQYFDARCGIQ
jgi:predicted extracellular nuclease